MNMDGRIMGLLNRLGDLFLLNIIYLVSCIPVVTIGAATTALYYTTFKMAENRESYVWRDYRQSFRKNWKQATEIWMILLAMILVLGADLLLIGGMSQALGAVVALVVIVLSIFLIMMGIYVFPVLARFDNTIKNIMKNALIMSIRHLPSTAVIVILHGVPLLLLLFSMEVFVRGVLAVLLFTVSILAYIQSKLFVKIFKNYYPRERTGDLCA